MSLEHDRLSGIEHIVAPAGAAEVAKARREQAKIRRLHHHAIFTKDAEATRHFYEDILEMKLVMSLRDEGDISPTSPTPFLHIFFEMGDGSMLAFFEAVPLHHQPDYEYPALSIFDHHLSVMVDDREAQTHFKNKLEREGYKVFEMDHGFCYSIYVDDPNGVHMEISCNSAEYEDHLVRAEQVSRRQLDAWTVSRRENEGRELTKDVGVEMPESWQVGAREM
ncbi:VOC family protein [Burkholderia sp. Bp9140]|uniref:VOC family protein n=1 Tax=Burkholderia sp. Bp9140 TaxID=2184572 RepID=UPI001624A771|nr:VOC family protein [Burkholderia sp. Bp9140]